MHITHDPRAQSRRELRAMRRLAKPAKQLHITDFVCLCVCGAGTLAILAIIAGV